MASEPRKRRVKLAAAIRELKGEGLETTSVTLLPSGAIELQTRPAGSLEDHSIDAELKRHFGNA